MEQFGTKDLYRVAIRATYSMRIGDKQIEQEEPIIYLDGAQIFAIGQNIGYRAARGGRSNFAHVVWEQSGDVNFTIQRGVLSPYGYALLTNLNVLDYPVDGTTVLTNTEIVETDNRGVAYLKYAPIVDKPKFAYVYRNKLIQDKIAITDITGDCITVDQDYANSVILVDYSHYYGQPVREYRLDRNKFNGYLSLEARYYTKGESGLERTNILYIPKMKVMSDISLRIGDNVASPTLSTFNIVAMAEKVDGEYSVMRMLQLDEDVDGL